MKSRLTLSRKLLFTWAMTIVAALTLVAIVFQFLLSHYNETVAKEKLFTSYISLKLQLNSHMDEMVSQAKLLAARKDIISGVNLISKYQDKNDYDTAAFDGEKKILANQLAEISINYSEIILYDRDWAIIALKYSDVANNKYVGIASYQNGEPILLSTLEDKTNYVESLWWDKLHIHGKPQVADTLLQEEEGTIHVEVFLPVVKSNLNDTNETVGMIHIGDNLSQYVSKKISPESKIAIQLYSKTGLEKILPQFLTGKEDAKNIFYERAKKEEGAWFETSTHFWSIHLLFPQQGLPVYMVVAIDKSTLNSQFGTVRDSVLWVMLIMVSILLPAGVWFIRRTITRPVQMLLDGVENVSEGKYDALKLIASRDELGSLARSFETMAREVQIREQKLADILGLAPEGIITIDEKFNITLFNKGAERTFGYNANEVMGKHLNMLLPHRFRGSHDKYIELFDSSEKAFSKMGRRGEISGLHKDGVEFPASASISKLIIGNEKAYTVLIQDITERKSAESELLTAKLDAEMANEAKSHFLASMSHELRTPLNAIIGMSDMIKGEYFGTLNEKYKEYAADIVLSGEHLLSLVNELLDISTIEAGKQELNKEFLSVHALVDDCIKIVKIRAAQGGVNIHRNIPKTLPPLKADMQAARKILLNLLSNAIKFMPEGGTVDISATENDSHITLSVKDNGVGIPKDKITSLMKPFARFKNHAHKAVEGWGLGLAISKSLMEMHDGTIWINSVEGQGTTVHISFPK